VWEFPHLKAELLGDADGFREHLVGIVDPKDCNHEDVVWKGFNHEAKEDECWCGVCGKELPCGE